MAKLKVSKFVDGKYKGPDIFQAAINNDPYEMAAALQDGQRLDDIQPFSNNSPIHLAAWSGSIRFLEVALQHETSDPWMQNVDGAFAIDLARTRRDKITMKMLFEAMHDENIEINPISAPKPPPLPSDP